MALTKALGNPPGLYVALSGWRPEGDVVRVSWSVWVVARNYRSHEAARSGDGATVGLLELADAAVATLLGLPGVTVQAFVPDRGVYVQSHGVYTGEITCSAGLDLPNAMDIDAVLADFETFHADYDIAPGSPGAHAGWLATPPDHSTAAPDAADTVNLNP